jgi:lipoprotein-anchoring transpeptidase ErfK/SrfK
MMGWDAPAKAVELMHAPLTQAAVGTVKEESQTKSNSADEVQNDANESGANPPQETIVLSNIIETDRPEKGPMVVVVEKERHITHVLQNHDGKLKEIFSAANTTGKKSTPTPNGRMMVANKRWDPEWTPPVSIDPAQKKVESWSKTHKNPLGVAWLGLNTGFVGMHGTNMPSMIGRNASHGCIRHKNEDIKKLYSLVPVGTPVYVVEKYAGTKITSTDVAYLKNAAEPQVVAHVHHSDSSNLPN